MIARVTEISVIFENNSENESSTEKRKMKVNFWFIFTFDKFTCFYTRGYQLGSIRN